MGILIVLPIAAAIAILDKRKIEEFLFPAIGVIVCLIIASGMLGNTEPGVVLGIVLGVIALLYCGVVFVKDKKRFTDAVVTPGFIAGTFCILISAFLMIGKTDLGKDNDTFWAHAPQVLNMYRFSDLGQESIRGNTFQLLYTAPVYTGWCYFCNKLWFGYSDGINLWARQIFIISAFLPFFTLIRKMEWKRMLLMSAILWMLPFFIDFSQDYMPDIPVGAAVVYAVLITIRLYQSKKKYNDPGYLLAGCLWLALISVMKRAGGIYTYGIVGIAVVCTIERFRGEDNERGFFTKVVPLLFMALSVGMTAVFCYYRYVKYHEDKLFTMQPFVSFVLLLLAGLVSAIVRKLVREKNYLLLVIFCGGIFFGGVSCLQTVSQMVRGKIYSEGGGDSGEILYKFMKMWFNREYYIGARFGNGWSIPDFVYILLLTGGLLLVRHLLIQKKLLIAENAADMDAVIIPVLIGYIFYMMFYCFIYMAIGEGYVVNGDIGYADRYFGPAVMLTTTVVIYELMSISKMDQVKLLTAILLFLLLLLPHNPFQVLGLKRDAFWEKYDGMYAAAGLELQEEDYLECIGPDHSLYYVFPAKADLDYGVKAAEISPEEWTERVREKGYQYLVLEDYDVNFPDTYQSLFVGGIGSIRPWSVYDVIIDGEQVRFVKRGVQ